MGFSKDGKRKIVKKNKNGDNWGGWVLDRPESPEKTEAARSMTEPSTSKFAALASDTEVPSSAEALQTVEASFNRMAELGGWPKWISRATLTARVPQDDGEPKAGFDAGIACALDLVPRDKQRLAATLHAAYTPEAITQIRSERKDLAGTETEQWLAACSLCDDQLVDADTFGQQLRDFAELSKDQTAMTAAASAAIDEMTSSYEVRDGVAYGLKDGGVIGAYIDGHEMGVAYSKKHDVWFVSTFHPSLGLDDFDWDNEPGSSSASGPVHGSRQYVKASNEDELERVLAAIQIEGAAAA